MILGPVALARRTADIAPFHVVALLARAPELEAAGCSVVHLEIGEPDFPTAGPILAAGQRALAEGRTRYTAAGLPEPRQAISDHYRERYGVTVPARRILITPGASGALQLATAATIMGLMYGAPVQTTLAVSERVWVVNSFSKPVPTNHRCSNRPPPAPSSSA